MVGPPNGAMMTETLLNRKGDFYVWTILAWARQSKADACGILVARLVIEKKTVYSYSIVYSYRLR
jgi:hypothetical protein